MSGKYDDFFLALASDVSSIEGLLDSFFDFLERRTDFFDILTAQNSSKGFEDGKAETLLINYFKKYQQKHHQRKTNTITTINSTSPDCIPLKNIPSQEKLENQENLNKQEGNKEYKKKNSSFDYNWEQTLETLSIEIRLERNESKVEVIFLDSTHLKIMQGSKCLLENELTNSIKVNESLWTSTKTSLMIELVKVKLQFWDSLFKNSQKIDLSKVKNEKNFFELDDETQFAIHKTVVQHFNKKTFSTQL